MKWLTFLLFLILPAFAFADTASDLKAHKQAEAAAVKHAAEAKAEADQLAASQVKQAAALRVLEDQTGQSLQNIASLNAQKAANEAQLKTAITNLQTLLPVLQKLSNTPPGTLLSLPQPPADSVRGLAILQGITSNIAKQITSVQALSTQQSALIAEAETAQTKLQVAAAAQQEAAAALARQINAAKATELAQTDIAAREAAARLEAQHKLDTLANAVARLSPHDSGPAILPPGGGAPVAGSILHPFGAATLAGAATGISYAAVPGANVISPCAGTILFAGPFPAYGEMVIADCGHANSVVLAGMAVLDVAAGQRIARGQPIGSMAANETHQPVLYLELRQSGKPVDPGPWLAPR